MAPSNIDLKKQFCYPELIFIKSDDSFSILFCYHNFHPLVSFKSRGFNQLGGEVLIYPLAQLLPLLFFRDYRPNSGNGGMCFSS